jgi:uncharacterized membrane protein
VRLARIALGVAHPFLIWLSLRSFAPRQVACAGLLLAGGHWLFRRKSSHSLRALALPAAAVALALVPSLVWNDPRSLLATPALVSFGLLAGFGLSLRGESVVEAIARAQHGPLSAEQTRYCRRVTLVWCVFFLANGVVALVLALTASTATWALYTGLLAYLLIGALFASEFVYRQWRFRRYVGAPTDVVFRRLFPPRAE